VPVNTNLTFTFNEPVQGFPGSIEIHKSDGTRVANIATLDTSQVSFSGAVVTVNPANDLAAGSDYYVIVTAGSIQDTAGNFFAGLTNPTTFNFTTVGQTNRPPVGVADTITVTGTAPVSKNILANDSDPDGDAIIITGITSQPTEGSVTFNSSGALTYQPNSNLTPADAGPDGYIHDQFGVQISDGHGGTAVEMVSADIFIQHYVVNLNTVGVPSMPNLPHPTRSPVQPIGAGFDGVWLPGSRPGRHLRLQGQSVLHALPRLPRRGAVR
jgi:hypothetical protein